MLRWLRHNCDDDLLSVELQLQEHCDEPPVEKTFTFPPTTLKTFQNRNKHDTTVKHNDVECVKTIGHFGRKKKKNLVFVILT